MCVCGGGGGEGVHKCVRVQEYVCVYICAELSLHCLRHRTISYTGMLLISVRAHMRVHQCVCGVCVCVCMHMYACVCVVVVGSMDGCIPLIMF